MYELIFFTTSRIKTQHIRYLSRKYDIKIVNFKEVRANANYTEPHIQNRDELLRGSFESAKKQAKISKLGKNKAFIIEDTSVNISALSQANGIEFPGVDIKFWMKKTLFADIDYELSMLGGVREATVRSDFVLYLPQKSEEPFYFHGETNGKVIEVDSEFETNPIYPWLDNKTFNKWFVPKGETSVISRLPIEKADVYDFRKKPFDEILSFLKSNNLIKLKSELTSEPLQQELENYHFHFVTGLTCAGKTSIANYLVEEIGFLHIEASDFMHEIYRENHGIEGKINIGNFAKMLLKANPVAVAERVVAYLKSFETQDVVITGFRLIEEINFVKSSLSLFTNTKLVFVEAAQSIREQRKAERSRDTNNVESLTERDKRELEMGTKEVVNQLDVVKVTNNDTFEDFYTEYKNTLNVVIKQFTLKKDNDINKLGLKKLIILALYVAREQQREKSDYFSTTDICNRVNQLGVSKHKFVNNIGRFFSQQHNALFEIKKDIKGKKYRLSNTGAGYAKVILRTFEFPLTDS